MNWLLLKNSLLVAGLTTFFATAVGFMVASFIVGSPRRCRELISVFAVIVLALPPFLVTNCWLHFLGTSGVWKKWVPLSIFSLSGTTWILVLMYWPVAMFFSLAAWQKLERSHMEVEPMLRGCKLLRYLLFPSASRELGVAAVLVFVLAFNNFAVPAILQVKVLPAELWVSFNTTFDYKTAAVLGWPLIVIPMVLLFMVRNRQVQWPRRSGGVTAGTFRSRMGWPLFGMFGVVSLLVLFFSAALPMGHIILSEQTWTAFVPALVAGKSAVWNSFLFAVVSACIVLALAALAGRYSIASQYVWISFLVPGVVLGVLLILIFNRPGIAAFYQSIGIVVLALVVRYLGPAFSFLGHNIRQADRLLVDAARLEGARGWALIRHAWLPQLIMPLIAAWYATYLLCLWDVETLVLIIPPGRETSGLRIFNLLHYGHNSQVNALCLWLLILAAVPLLLWIMFSAVCRRIRWTMLVVGIAAVFCGCSVSDSDRDDRGAGVKSRFFNRVEIIGSRGTGLGQFNKPRSVALDRDDNLYVVDMTGRVQKFSPDGRYLLHWQMPQTDLGRPKGMGLDGDGNIIIIEPHYSRVNHFAPDGTLVYQWGIHGTGDGHLAFPRAVAVNEKGEMYLSEYGATERVQHFAARGERFLHSFGIKGAKPGEFNRPEGLGLDKNSHIFIADSCNHRVQVFSPDGSFLRSFGKAGSALGDLSYPYDVRVDANGFRYVCEFGNSRIQIFDQEDRPVETLGGPGSAPGQFANPWSIAFDSRGNLFVADSQNHRVQKFIRK